LRHWLRDYRFTRLRRPVLDWIRSWRLAPFYAAAILVSIAALRYIFSE
jgi:hypothetical protein